MQLLGWVFLGFFFHGEICMQYEQQRSGFAYKLPKKHSLGKKYKVVIFK